VIEKGIAMKPVRKQNRMLAASRVRSSSAAFTPCRRSTGACLLVLLCLMLATLFPLHTSAADATYASGQEGIYWRVSQDGREAGFLLGTIHSEDPRVVDFSEAFIAELKSCQVFAMEMVPDLPTLKKLTEYMHYQEQDRLLTLLGQERFDRAMLALNSYQVPNDWKSRMKVWAVMMTLSVPAPQTGFFMDLSLSLRAAGSGLHVTGLETLEQQLQFLEQMPLDFQLELLDHALDDYQRVGEIHEEMVQVYLQNSLSALDSLSQQQFAVLDPEITRYFIDMGIAARNQQMAATVLPQLAENRVFIAVGALHLGGEEGLINLLRQGGYELTALPMPFQPEQQSAP